MIIKIFIKDIAKELGYKDTRSIKRWCDNHNIGILSDFGSNRQYVFKSEYEIARDRIVNKYIKQKYGIKIVQPVIHIPENIIANNDNSVQPEYNYTPIGKSEKKFLESSIFTKV
jgi:hypothetical protein